MNTEIKTAILEVLSTARIYKRRAARSWSNALAAAAMVVVTSLISGPSFSAQPEVDLVPWPKSLSVLDGRMDLTAKSRIVYADPSLEPLAEVFAQEISEATCLELPVVQDEPAAGDLFLKLSSAASFTGEAYRVEVGKHATAEAANYNAVALATVTLLQAITKRDGGYSLPRMLVLDEPEASYRGLMVDVARNYHSIKTLKEMVEMCRLYKVRYLQLHLTDDQAFTIPSKSYPQLTERSAYHYTLEELRDLVAYADQRGVTLIPEIDTPAHSTSFTRSMPDLFASPGGGVVNFADDEVWKAMSAIVNEVCDIFQSAPYIHLGADEANLYGMDRDPEFIAAIQRYEVGDIHGLFNRYISHLAGVIEKRGKKTIAWEGFDYGKTDKAKMDTGVAVMMFDNAKSPQAYLDAGYKVINASWNPMYVVGFDGLGRGVYPKKIFEWDRFQFHGFLNYPMTERRPKLNPLVKPTPNVIGAQMCSWEMLENREVPRVRFRIAPYADRIWNSANQKGFDQFRQRYASTDRLLDLVLAEHRPPEPPANVGASDGFLADRIRVGWRDGGNYARTFALYRGTKNDPAAATLIADALPKTQTSYEDKDVESGVDYYYWVKASNRWGSSPYSAAVTGRTGAEQLGSAYEPFDYAEGTEVAGANGGEGFAAGWDHQSSSGPLKVVPQSLAYPGLPSKAGALRVNHVRDVAATLERTLARETGRDMSNLWMSFLVKGDKVAHGWLTAEINNSLRFGKESVNGIGIHYHTTVFMEDNVTYLLVLHVDCRPGNDDMFLWVNPSIGEQPAKKDADSYWEVSDIGVGKRLRFNLSGTGMGQYLLDEVRVGATWDEVVGKQPLSGSSKP